jgi:hypothetical protein
MSGDASFGDSVVERAAYAFLSEVILRQVPPPPLPQLPLSLTAGQVALLGATRPAHSLRPCRFAPRVHPHCHGR